MAIEKPSRKDHPFQIKRGLKNGDVHLLKEEYHTQEKWFRTRNKEQKLLHNQQITMAISPRNGEGNIMHLEVPNKLPNGMQVDKERF